MRSYGSIATSLAAKPKIQSSDGVDFFFFLSYENEKKVNTRLVFLTKCTAKKTYRIKFTTMPNVYQIVGVVVYRRGWVIITINMFHRNDSSHVHIIVNTSNIKHKSSRVLSPASSQQSNCLSFHTFVFNCVSTLLLLFSYNPKNVQDSWSTNHPVCGRTPWRSKHARLPI